MGITQATDNFLFIMMLQMSAASALLQTSKSDQHNECREWVAGLNASSRPGLIFTIQVENQAV